MDRDRGKDIEKGIKAIEDLEHEIGLDCLASAIQEWADSQSSFWKNVGPDEQDLDLADRYDDLSNSADSLAIEARNQ